MIRYLFKRSAESAEPSIPTELRVFDYQPKFDRAHRQANRIVWLLLLGATLGVGAYHWQPEVTSPWTLADAAWQMGLTDSALPLYQRAVAEYPYDSDLPMAEFRIARCLQKAGDHDAATDAYRHFLQAYPDHTLSAAVRATLEVYPIAFVE